MENKNQKLTTYAFIDSQNLNLGVKGQGWNLDWRKFRQYLKDKYNVSNAYLFIGFVRGNEGLYKQLEDYGFIVVKKQTMSLRDGTVKGNVDAELVLHAMIQFPNYSKAIIVSGDGDFHCLVEYLQQKGKLLNLIVPTPYSRLLKQFSSYIICIDQLKVSLERKEKTGIGGRSKP